MHDANEILERGLEDDAIKLGSIIVDHTNVFDHQVIDSPLLADFVEPDALPEEYVKGRIFASNVSHAPMPKYNNSIKVVNVEVPVIDVSSNIALRDLARWIRENHQASSEKS